ncbi:MAG: cytochrome c biogenesis protein ResB [Oscillospiraceae bacterium]|nr:cytochrome c biogenesis protein ResB [Oscillospiraceae bacterium]
MKKLFSFLRSMRFGVLLLALIGLCSVAGTVIPQGREIAWYAQTYRSFHAAILLLRLHRVFESWYFIALILLLCVNLSLCSLTRIRSVTRAAKNEGDRAAALPDQKLLTSEGLAVLRAHMEAMRCREEKRGGVTLWRKNGFGRYGTFVTHLSILLTVVFGALALYTPTTEDHDIMPGETLTLEDGTQIRIDSFRLTDETGRLDYESTAEITLPDGRSSGVVPIRVNHPVSFGSYKLFQQSFGTAGSITVTDLAGGGSDEFLLTETSFLTADGRSGLWYEVLYPDYIRAPSGEVTLITLTEGSYPNPIYQVLVVSGEEYTPTLAVPGDTLEVFGLRFTFNEPVEYPGIRVKHVSRLFNGLLVAAFTLMILGLYLTFFCEPVLVKTDESGYAVAGPRPERMRIELENLLEEYAIEAKPSP